MSTPPKATVAAPMFAAPAPDNLLQITIASNLIAANASDVNSYSLRNAILIQEEKARVEYKNGVTLPTSVRVLLANAANKGYNHRRTLSRNIVAATSKSRPGNVCAHHIVALGDPEARSSRALLFGWGIGINDADNGVFLPSKKGGLLDYPDAARHTPRHEPAYHLAVFRTLSLERDVEGGRGALRSIKAALLSGILSL